MAFLSTELLTHIDITTIHKIYQMDRYKRNLSENSEMWG